MVMKFVLLSTLWYFLSIWCESATILHKIRASLRNYLWAGIEEHSRARVRWNDCCASKKVGGLGIVNPENALIALMSKWVIKALTPGIPPLHILLRYWLASLWPSRLGPWSRSLQWTLLGKFAGPQGLSLWICLIKWRCLSPLIEALSPKTFKEVQNTSLWWTT